VSVNQMAHNSCSHQLLFPGGIISKSIVEEKSQAYLILLALKSYPKFRSAISLCAARLPTTDGMIIFEINENVNQTLQGFIRKHNLEKVLLRSERMGRRLGYPSKQEVPINKIHFEVRNLMAQGPDTIIAIQTAGKIFKNFYNINMEINPYNPLSIVFEISGPGFTATDLNRFGILHERITVPSYAIELYENILKREYLVEEKTYLSHKQIKLDRWGIEKLKKEKSLLLDYMKYPIIPLSILQRLWLDLPQIKKAIEWLDLSDSGCIVSLSFIQQENGLLEHFYWDIHPLK